MSREAMQQALEAMERYQVKRQDFDRFADEITALRKALANEALDKKAENARELGLDYEPVCNKDPQGCWNVRCQLGKKCKNTQAQRTWVSLTDEELSEVYNQADWDTVNGWEYERAIEAKLKEKNT